MWTAKGRRVRVESTAGTAARLVTPLERALRDRIRRRGRSRVEAYMEACNAYYYATRDPLGARGDFTTAPEISQMFGEMVGACLADAGSAPGRRRTPSMPSLGRAGERSRATRCGCSELRAFAARSISSKRARSCARRRGRPCPTRIGTKVSRASGAAVAARRQRVPRRAADPPACRRHGAAGACCRRRPRLRSRRRDRRDFAGSRRSGGRDCDLPRREGRRRRCSSIMATSGARPATRFRRCAAMAFRRARQARASRT